MPGPSNKDMAKDFGWNLMTGLPLVGSLVAGKYAMDDLHNMREAQTEEQREQAQRDFASDMISATPGVGTVSSVAGMMYDVLAWGNDTSGNLTNQLLGGKDRYKVDEDAIVRGAGAYQPPDRDMNKGGTEGVGNY